MRVGSRDLTKRQDLTAVVSHEFDRLASMPKREHARRTSVVVEVCRPLLFVYYFARLRAHVHITPFHDESLGRRELFSGEEGGEFRDADRPSFLLMFGKGACRATERPCSSIDHPDHPRMRVDRSLAGVTLLGLRSAIDPEPGISEAGGNEDRREYGQPAFGCHEPPPPSILRPAGLTRDAHLSVVRLRVSLKPGR
jgi:hypothetical protein